MIRPAQCDSLFWVSRPLFQRAASSRCTGSPSLITSAARTEWICSSRSIRAEVVFSILAIVSVAAPRIAVVDFRARRMQRAEIRKAIFELQRHILIDLHFAAAADEIAVHVVGQREFQIRAIIEIDVQVAVDIRAAVAARREEQDARRDQKTDAAAEVQDMIEREMAVDRVAILCSGRSRRFMEIAVGVGEEIDVGEGADQNAVVESAGHSRSAACRSLPNCRRRTGHSPGGMVSRIVLDILPITVGD